MPGHPHAEALAEVCADQWGGATLVLGGYGTDCNGCAATEIAALLATEAERRGRRPSPGATSPDPDDWVLLAEFTTYVASSGGAAVFWVVQRDDLIARRFDRTQVVVDYNP